MDVIPDELTDESVKEVLLDLPQQQYLHINYDVLHGRKHSLNWCPVVRGTLRGTLVTGRSVQLFDNGWGCILRLDRGVKVGEVDYQRGLITLDKSLQARGGVMVRWTYIIAEVLNAHIQALQASLPRITPNIVIGVNNMENGAGFEYDITSLGYATAYDDSANPNT